MKIILLIQILLLLCGCTGLVPEAQPSTFLLLKNRTDEPLGFFVDDYGRRPVAAGKSYLLPVEPGLHVVTVRYGTVTTSLVAGPDTLFVEPCTTDTLSYGYSD